MIDLSLTRQQLAALAQLALNDAVKTIDDLSHNELEAVTDLINRELRSSDPLIRMVGTFAALGLRFANEASWIKGPQ